ARRDVGLGYAAWGPRGATQVPWVAPNVGGLGGHFGAPIYRRIPGTGLRGPPRALTTAATFSSGVFRVSTQRGPTMTPVPPVWATASRASATAASGVPSRS